MEINKWIKLLYKRDYNIPLSVVKIILILLLTSKQKRTRVRRNQSLLSIL